MTKRGFIFDVTDEMENSGLIHQRLVARIEGLIGRNVLCYIANFGSPHAAILDVDGELIENVLRSVKLEKYDGKLTLFLESPGGVPYAAEKILRILRSYSSSLEVLVPNQAMSAATLICLGADAVVMSDTSKLGPIDPQMVYNDGKRTVLRPAKAFIDGYLELVNSAKTAIMSDQSADPFLRMLDRLDISWIMECVRAQSATKTIAAELLANGMMKDSTKETIDEVVSQLHEAGETVHHSRPIYWETAKQTLGLNVCHIEKDDPVWNAVWELYVRSQRHANQKGLAKYVFVRSGGIDFNLKRQ